MRALLLAAPTVALFLAAGAASAAAQDPAPTERRPAALYAELGGNGFYYSINYETELARGWMGRVGLSALPGFDEGSVIAAPLLVERLIGEGENKLELGLGVVPRYRDERELWWTAAIGWRRVRENGVLFRVTLTPLVESTLDTASIWVGVSFGRMLE